MYNVWCWQIEIRLADIEIGSEPLNQIKIVKLALREIVY